MAEKPPSVIIKEDCWSCGEPVVMGMVYFDCRSCSVRWRKLPKEPLAKEVEEAYFNSRSVMIAKNIAMPMVDHTKPLTSHP